MVFFGPFSSGFSMDFQAPTSGFLRGAIPIAAGRGGSGKSAGANTRNYCMPTLV
jgi:hypothetical protein